MPSIRQPKLLETLCTEAASQWVIRHSLTMPKLNQEARMRELYMKHIPPPLLQDVLHCTLRQLAVRHKKRACITVIASILHTLTHPRQKELNLSDLACIGTLNFEVMDKIETVLIQLLPSMTELTHLDLSTCHDDTSLSTCSPTVLRTLTLQIVGSSCPNLTFLNLNNNSRVNFDGLWFLLPSQHQAGCVKLEKLFIHACSLEPEDVAILILHLPNLKQVVYEELGRSFDLLHSHPRKLGSKKQKCQYNFKLTHVDNTMSLKKRCDLDVINFVCEACPNVENLKVRVCDEDVEILGRLPALKHLELQFFTGVHHNIGNMTMNYVKCKGSLLSSLTIYCKWLSSNHVKTIAENCWNLTRLYLNASQAEFNLSPKTEKSKMDHLEVLSVKIKFSVISEVNDLVLYLVREAKVLQELHMSMPALGLTHEFIKELLEVNSLSHLTTFMAVVARPHHQLSICNLTKNTALLLIDSCASLQTLGNLIYWRISLGVVQELQAMMQLHNYNLTLIHQHTYTGWPLGKKHRFLLR